MNAPTKLPRVSAALRQLAAAARADVVRHAGDPELRDCCIAASLYLQARAAAAGHTLTVVGGAATGVRRAERWHPPMAGHVWCERDGWIIDITATQFWRVSPVYIVRAPHPRFSVDLGPVCLDLAVLGGMSGRVTELTWKLLAALGVKLTFEGAR